MDHFLPLVESRQESNDALETEPEHDLAVAEVFEQSVQKQRLEIAEAWISPLSQLLQDHGTD